GRALTDKTNPTLLESRFKPIGSRLAWRFARTFWPARSRTTARSRTGSSAMPTTGLVHLHHQLVYFGLLFRRQFVFERDGQAKMQPLDFPFRIQHFVELSQRLLFVDRIRLHKLVQRLHRILHLPLQFIEACRRPLNLSAHESLLLLRKIEFTRVSHDQ